MKLIYGFFYMNQWQYFSSYADLAKTTDFQFVFPKLWNIIQKRENTPSYKNDIHVCILESMYIMSWQFNEHACAEESHYTKIHF
jgi:hypothetical protein